MSLPLKKAGISVAATAAAALALAACSSAPSTEDVSKAGFIPAATPVKTFTCFDFNGAVVFKTTDVDSVRTDGTYGYHEMRQKSASNAPHTYTSGMGCVFERLYFDPNVPANVELLAQAKKQAKLTGLVTNGMSAIILADKFSKVENWSGVTWLTLQAPNGTKLREVAINSSLQVIATPLATGIGADISEALKAHPQGSQVLNP